MRFTSYDARPRQERLISASLTCIHIIICCVSLAFVTQLYETYHLYYDPTRIFHASLVVAAFALVSLLFLFADFSFGYFVGFYFYTMVLGYLWLSFFSDFSYNRELAGFSAAVSAVAFLLPTLFISGQVGRTLPISIRRFDLLLACLFLLCLATVAVGASYNFKFVSPRTVSSYRSDELPAILRYLVGTTSSVLLPYLFACFVARKSYGGAGAVLLLLFFYYPVAMSKTALFAPAWLVSVALLSRFFGSKITVILSLLGPIFVGVILLVLFRYQIIPYNGAMPYFEIVNFRMIAVPSSALDFYNDFFFKHELTYFCQIWILKPIISCPYDQLSLVMMRAYPFVGNFNASLFATEGVASVGALFAPIAAFACGLVLAFGNRLSAGLPASFVLVSGGILPLILLNIPLSTVLLTHGGAFLFMLWYITPRSMFEIKQTANVSYDNKLAPR